jgi:hypothetical protein
MLTIQWSLAPSALRPQRRQAKLIERASKWLSRRHIPIAFIWVLEQGFGAEPHGHILVHLPQEHVHAFRQKICDWIGTPWVPRQVTFRSIYDVDGAEEYVLKGLDHDAAEALGVRRPRSQGVVHGKRVGTSESIGRAARARHPRWREQ